MMMGAVGNGGQLSTVSQLVAADAASLTRGFASSTESMRSNLSNTPSDRYTSDRYTSDRASGRRASDEHGQDEEAVDERSASPRLTRPPRGPHTQRAAGRVDAPAQNPAAEEATAAPAAAAPSAPLNRPVSVAQFGESLANGAYTRRREVVLTIHAPSSPPPSSSP